MTSAQKLLTKLRSERTVVLSRGVLAKVDKIAKSKKQSIAFLKKGGFLNQQGKLAAKYRLPSER